jgi:hypothetical protein
MHSDVDRIVRLHHRRRGWAWIAGGSLIGFLVYAVIDSHLFDNLAGGAEVASLTPIYVLVALILVGLIVTIVDTVRLHRADAGARTSARKHVSHHPLYSHGYRYPPRHHGSWVFGIVMLAAMTAIAVDVLPAEVNSVAYLAGAENRTTFNPVSYTQFCGPRVGCSTETKGYLADSGEEVTWPGQVPLTQPLPVRVPLWAFGTGRSLIYGDPTAIVNILVGLFFDALAAMLVYALAVMAQHELPRRRALTARPIGVSPRRRPVPEISRYKRRIPPTGFHDHEDLFFDVSFLYLYDELFTSGIKSSRSRALSGGLCGNCGQGVSLRESVFGALMKRGARIAIYQ